MSTITRKTNAKSAWNNMQLEPANVVGLEDFFINEPYAHLLAWVRENSSDEKYKFAEAKSDQIVFLRDKCFMDIFRGHIKAIEVISTHTSKSVVLPVYHIMLNDGTEFILRDNFYDWKVTVRSDKEFDLPLDLFSGSSQNADSNKISSSYCEGFDDSWILPIYTKENRSGFTVEVSTDYFLFAMLFYIKQQSGFTEEK